MTTTRAEQLLQASSDAMQRARAANATGDSYNAVEALIEANIALAGLVEEVTKS